MQLVAVLRSPPRPDEAAAALAATAGITPAEARMRLAPEPPALVGRLDAVPARALVGALRDAGVAALALESRVPTDAERVAARTVALDVAGATFAPVAGEPMEVAWADVVAILRGARQRHLEIEREQKIRRRSLTTAIATGGLWTTRTSVEKTRSSQTAFEQVILVYARDGRAASLAEGRVDFSCLGPGLQPSSAANMAELASRLRQRAPGAFYDERLLRLGRRPLPFLAGAGWSSSSGATTVTRTDTSGSLDVLAEIMRQAVAAGLLP